MNQKSVLLSVAIGCATSGPLLPARLHADEGMWLFNNPPRTELFQRYGFEPTDEWLLNVQRASVRFNSGGSASLVSADGLIMTNHHVGADSLQKLSTPKRDLMTHGFYARTREAELRCVDDEINILMEIEDVTERVNGAVAADLDPAAAAAARRAEMNTIEEESLKQTGLRSDVVTLYQGGQYHLYRYKKYTDVRLVFAPERDIAFFGGDPDNFEYPRFDLDICFFRAYEDGKPAKIEHFLKFNPAGAADGDLIFVSGHPGRTDRLNTVYHLELLRDLIFPTRLRTVFRREVLLRAFSERDVENARRAGDELFSQQNTRKAFLGALAGLQDPAQMERKRSDEKALREAVEADPALKADCGEAWDQVRSAIDLRRETYLTGYLLEAGQAFNSDLFSTARTIVRLVEERQKPNAERLREYAEAGLESLEQQLYSEKPIYPDLETLKLADSLSMYLEMVGPDDDLARRVLDGQSPTARAAGLIEGTKLADVEERRRLVEGGPAAVESSPDPMVQLARLVDEPSRAARKIFEDQVDEPLKQAYARIARARFAVHGESQYPDATFTLRLAYGEVKGYREQSREIAPLTTLQGLFERADEHKQAPPFNLPPSWLKSKDKLDLATPMNFVCTADIIGGNSGSPVVNRAGELVGIIFDGNIHSLVLDFAYSDEQARAIAVHSAGIIEALKNVYHADRLLEELMPQRN